MRKNKVLHKKADQYENRKANAESFPGININKELKLGTCKHYDKYNDRILQGGDWKDTNDMEMKRLATCDTQVLEFGDRSCNSIVKIQRYPIKFSNSAIFVDLIKTIKIFIIERFCLTYPKIDGEIDGGFNINSKKIKSHICNTVDRYSSYVLVDKVRNRDYYLDVKNGLMDPDQICDRIVCIMVCELDILVGSRKISSSLIHYLGTYPTIQGRGYASKVMKMVFEQDVLQNKSVYAVTKLPEFHAPSLKIIDIKCDEVQNSTKMQQILNFPANGSSEFFKKFKFSLKKDLWWYC